MQYTSDPQFLLMIFILPGLFGVTMVAEGIGKVMNYDGRGWIGIAAGSLFITIIIIAFFFISSSI